MIRRSLALVLAGAGLLAAQGEETASREKGRQTPDEPEQLRRTTKPVRPGSEFERELIAELLRSGEASKQAWGAHLAGNYGRREYRHEILRLAESDDGRVRGAAMDAAIRLSLEIPEEALARWAEKDFDSALILIAPKVWAFPRVVQVLRGQERGDTRWVALQSVLASKPPPGYAASMWKEWTVRVTIAVADPGQDLGPRAKGRPGGHGDGTGTDDPNYPPSYRHELIESPRAGDALLALGPHPVGYRRVNGDTEGSFVHDRDEYREDYLRFMAQLTGEVPQWTREDQWVIWRDAEAYRRDVGKIRNGVRAYVEELKRALRARGEIGEGEDADPRIKVTVEDRRRATRAQLPEVRFGW